MVRLLRLVVPVGRGQTQIPVSGPITDQRCRRRDPWARRGRELWRCSPRFSRRVRGYAVARQPPLIILRAISAGGQDQRAIRGNGNGVLGVCAS